MKTDELFNSTEVDVSKAATPRITHSLEQWVDYQREAGFKRSFCFAIAYFGDSDNDYDNPRLPDIDLLVSKIEYALDVYTTKHSDVHIEEREWKNGYPDVQLDFCAEFSIRRPYNFLNFITFAEDCYDEYLDKNPEFLGQTMFRDFDNIKMPKRDEEFYTPQIVLTALRYGFNKYTRTKDIADMRLRKTDYDSYKFLVAEIEDGYPRGYEDWKFVAECLTMANTLRMCRMFPKFDSIDLRRLAHHVFDWTWKYKCKNLGVSLKNKINKNASLIKGFHETLDRKKFIETVYPDSDRIYLEWYE